jgi:acyl-CoA synthetase (AMP-forming)/AMP-acid ligase II
MCNFVGDIGYLDPNGYLFIVDRLKELIKVNGRQVAPAELEDILQSYAKISDAAVIGTKDVRHGEVPLAFVVRKDATISEREVHEMLKGKLHCFGKK